MTQKEKSRPNHLAGSIALAILLFVVGFAVWWFAFRQPKPKPDPIAATAANVRGVGYMEQFDYSKAKVEFEEAVRLAPDWLPARINLGMALYNSASFDKDPVLPEAIAVFEQVLREDPDNPYAHFNLGIILLYQGVHDQAAKHFQRVTELDPRDDRAWLYLGQSDPNAGTSEQAKKYFEKALELNPYLVPARYAIASHILTTEDEQKKLLPEVIQLRQANWEDEARPARHSEQGRYATAIGSGLVKPADIGPLPMFDLKSSWTVEGGVRWDDGARDRTTKFDALLNTARSRFGGCMVRFDYNRDGKPDLLLLSSAYRDGKLSNVLLKNDGTKFIDVSIETGLGDLPGLGCAVGDYDNDGWPDLAISTEFGIRLLRNADGKKWEDKTAAAGFDSISGVFHSLGWLDLDQDGDLDLIAGLTGDTGKLVVLQNVGIAPPSRADEPTPPMSTAFKPVDLPSIPVAGSVAGVVALDIDGDKDVDLVVLHEDKSPLVILNERLMRFKDGGQLSHEKNLTGGLILDANGDEQSDLFFTTNGKPDFLVSTQALPDADFGKRFTAGATNSSDLLQAHRCDLDQDGRADVIGLSKDLKPVFLQGDGTGKLTHQPDVFGTAFKGLSGLRAIGVADLNGDGTPDLIAWHSQGVSVMHGIPNGNHTARVLFTGKRDNNNAGSDQKNLRTNADGMGTKAIALTGPLQSVVELTTLSSGLGQSSVPVEFGIGKATQVDTIRIRWPDCVVQAELGIPIGAPFTISELNRKPTSCPVLMTWDGTKWVYVTDFLGGGAMGEYGQDGKCRPPRSEESVKIESHQLGMRNGRFTIRIAEPMDEVMYLDHVRLDVIDHHEDAVVYPDERFAVTEPLPTQKPLLFRNKIRPTKATDHKGIDRTDTVRTRDGSTVDGFARRSWLGFAEDHWLELEFPMALDDLPKNSTTHLVLAGWTDYPYPESIIAANQAGIVMAPPILERQSADGKWEKLGDLGFPAGLPKVITVPIGEWLKGKGTKFRIRTNLQIYWDQVFVGVAEEQPVAHQLKPQAVELRHPGFVQEIRTGGKLPQAYDPDRFEPVAVTKWSGKLTKLGDVTELMADIDDRFVLCGPGDEVTVSFDPSSLPPLPNGHKRSFILRTHGYCKDTSPTTATGGSVGPLPFRGMQNYPPTTEGPKVHAGDMKQWHTRPAGGSTRP